MSSLGKAFVVLNHLGERRGYVVELRSVNLIAAWNDLMTLRLEGFVVRQTDGTVVVDVTPKFLEAPVRRLKE